MDVRHIARHRSIQGRSIHHANDAEATDGYPRMSKKLLLIAAAIAGISGLCVLIMREARERSVKRNDHVSDAQWANEGGANAPASV